MAFHTTYTQLLPPGVETARGKCQPPGPLSRLSTQGCHAHPLPGMAPIPGSLEKSSCSAQATLVLQTVGTASCADQGLWGPSLKSSSQTLARAIPQTGYSGVSSQACVGTLLKELRRAAGQAGVLSGGRPGHRGTRAEPGPGAGLLRAQARQSAGPRKSPRPE